MESLDHRLNSYEEIEAFLDAHFWPVFRAKTVPRVPITDMLFERLTDIEQIEAVAPYSEPSRRKPILINTAVHRVPNAARAVGLSSAVPPLHIHRMQKKEPLWCGDFYSANMLGQALQDASIPVEPGAKYLDFGCSSGSLVRVMQAAYPQAIWHGVDPIASSIEWASTNLLAIRFSRNDQRPPLGFDEAFFDGVYAISIWSHFSEMAAFSWFADMARIIRPGGWLVFTTHGWTAIKRHTTRRTRQVIKLQDLTLRLLNGYAFEKTNLQEGLDKAEWGCAYLTVEWVARYLTSKDWSLRLFQPGRNQSHQDVYVLSRRRPLPSNPLEATCARAFV